MTKYIDIKSGCKFKKFTYQFTQFVRAVIRTWDLQAPAIVPVITSANDRKHMTGSLHYEDLAWDLRSNNIPDAGKVEEIARTLRVDLGSDWDVVVEKDHIHVEFDRGLKKQPPKTLGIQ